MMAKTACVHRTVLHNSMCCIHWVAGPSLGWTEYGRIQVAAVPPMSLNQKGFTSRFSARHARVPIIFRPRQTSRGRAHSKDKAVRSPLEKPAALTKFRKVAAPQTALIPTNSVWEG